MFSHFKNLTSLFPLGFLFLRASGRAQFAPRTPTPPRSTGNPQPKKVERKKEQELVSSSSCPLSRMRTVFSRSNQLFKYRGEHLQISPVEFLKKRGKLAEKQNIASTPYCLYKSQNEISVAYFPSFSRRKAADKKGLNVTFYPIRIPIGGLIQ